MTKKEAIEEFDILMGRYLRELKEKDYIDILLEISNHAAHLYDARIEKMEEREKDESNRS